MKIKSFLRDLIFIAIGSFLNSRKSKVLYYHDVYDHTKYTDMGTSLEMFKKHLETIREKGFTIVDAITKSENQVMICFDDGFRGIWDCRSFFIENDLHPTIFISNSLIGKDSYLSLSEIKELHKSGFLFEGHSRSHTNLTKFKVEDLKKELSSSLTELRCMTGINIKDLCFPQGFYSDKVLEIAKECGYRYLYSSDPGPYIIDQNNYLIPRYLLQWSTPLMVRSILNGGIDCFYNHYKKYHKQ